MRCDERQRCLAIGRLDRAKSGFAQREDKQLANVCIVVDDQDRAEHRAQDHPCGTCVNGVDADPGATAGAVLGGGGGAITAPSQSRPDGAGRNRVRAPISAWSVASRRASRAVQLRQLLCLRAVSASMFDRR